jgi:acetolactate synthase-1/3 small subunit
MLPLRSLLNRQCAAPLRLQQRASSSSSTQALAYKALHRRIAPLPTEDRPPAWSAPAAVSNILYETPLPSQAPPKSHILNCLVQNEPGVLSRVSGILAARGFNIDSLVVCNTEVDDLSRMTIVLQGQDGVVEQARRQLEDLVPVWAVLDYTQSPLVQRELLLAKVSILGPEYFEELLAHHREMAQAPDVDEAYEPDLTDEERNAMAQEAARESLRKDYHPTNLPVSQALRHKHEHLRAITFMTHQFGGKVLDISTNNCIVEVSAKPTRIDSFMKLIAPFGILESARTGKRRRISQHSQFANQVQASWLYPDPRSTTVLTSKRWKHRTLSTTACSLLVKRLDTWEIPSLFSVNICGRLKYVYSMAFNQGETRLIRLRPTTIFFDAI